MIDLTKIDYFPRYYVGVKGREAFSTTNFPLGFATPHEDNAAFRKRRETVDKWSGAANTPYDGNIIENSPTPGFKIGTNVSRYHTDNKMFRIHDPRGFTLEIDTSNLYDLIQNHTIDKGVIQANLVWGRISGSNYLVAGDRISLKKKDYDALKTSLEVGDWVTTSYGGQDEVYLGKFYRNYLTFEAKYPDASGKCVLNHQEYFAQRTIWGKAHEWKNMAQFVLDEKPFHLFYYRCKYNKRDEFRSYRSLPKITKNHGKRNDPFVTPNKYELFAASSYSNSQEITFLKESKSEGFDKVSRQTIADFVKSNRANRNYSSGKFYFDENNYFIT